MTDNLHLIGHGLATHKLSLMRDKSTRPSRFRRLVRQTSLILCSEMTRDLDLQDKDVITPKGVTTKGKFRDQGSLVIMPILRAGLVVAESFSELLPMARIAHVGIFRDEDDERHCYMLSLPQTEQMSKFIILDVSLSRGKSMSMAVRYLIDAGIPPGFIRCGCILASKEGIKHLQKEHPDVEIYAVGLDESLDQEGYLHPGFGDPSARMFRTDRDPENDEEVFE